MSQKKVNDLKILKPASYNFYKQSSIITSTRTSNVIKKPSDKHKY